MTTDETSGEQPSGTLSAQAKTRASEAALDKYEDSIGLHAFGVSKSIESEAHKYLGLEAAQRAKLTPEECSEAVLILSQYAAHVGRSCQRCEAAAFTGAEQINRAIIGQVDQYKGWAFEERRAKALFGNVHATELDRVRVQNLAQHKRLLFLAQRIEKIAEAYKGLAFLKRRNNEYGG